MKRKPRKTEEARGWGLKVGGPNPYLAFDFAYTRYEIQRLCTATYHKPVRCVLVPLAEWRRMKHTANNYYDPYRDHAQQSKQGRPERPDMTSKYKEDGVRVCLYRKTCRCGRVLRATERVDPRAVGGKAVEFDWEPGVLTASNSLVSIPCPKCQDSVRWNDGTWRSTRTIEHRLTV